MNSGNQGFLSQVFRAAVGAVDPAQRVARHLVRDAGGVRLLSRAGKPLARIDGRVMIVAAGKAACGMAGAAAAVLGPQMAAGVVAAPSVPRGLAAGFSVFVAGHPLPDRGSLAAGRAAWRLVGQARPDDTVLALLSGGASSLLVLPASGISLRDKTAAGRALLRAGATIAEVNTVRKHLSQIKGGGLARRAGEARVCALLLSDVIAGSPSVIGSGPFAADPTTFSTAWGVLERYRLLDRVPRAVRDRIDAGRHGRLPETPKPGELRSRHVRIGDNRLALDAAARESRSHGVPAKVLTASLRGDTRRAARRLAGEAMRWARSGRPICLLAGGETTVEVRGSGRGGRNQEFALAFALALDGRLPVACLSAGTDGIDGPTDAAGAFADASTVARARQRGLEPERLLERNDSWIFFRRLGDQFRPGPTGTNVMDLKIVLVGRGGPGIGRRGGRAL